MLCAINVSLGLVTSGVLTWAPTSLVRQFNFSTTSAGLITSLYSAVGILSGLTAGFFADRIFKRRNPLLLLAILSQTAVIAISVLENAYMNVLLLLLSGFFGPMGWIVGPAMMSDWFSLRAAGTVTGLLGATGSMGGALGPLIFGAVLDATGSFGFGWLTLGLIALVRARCRKKEGR